MKYKNPVWNGYKWLWKYFIFFILWACRLLTDSCSNERKLHGELPQLWHGELLVVWSFAVGTSRFSQIKNYAILFFHFSNLFVRHDTVSLTISNVRPFVITFPVFFFLECLSAKCFWKGSKTNQFRSGQHTTENYNS